MFDDRIFVGVLRLELVIPGARSLKDRRQAVSSLRDRIRHKFPVTFSEVGDTERPAHQVVVCTTAGNDSRLIRSILDQIAGFAASSGRVIVGSVDVDVFRWHPGGQSEAFDG